MRSITVYRTEKGQVVKTHSLSKPASETYDAIMSVPFHQRVLNTYYDLECQGKHLGVKNKGAVAQIHKAALEEGF